MISLPLFYGPSQKLKRKGKKNYSIKKKIHRLCIIFFFFFENFYVELIKSSKTSNTGANSWEIHDFCKRVRPVERWSDTGRFDCGPCGWNHKKYWIVENH